MDESAIFDDSIIQRSYSPIGETPNLLTENNHNRDTIVLCCSDDGVKLPIFFIHHEKRKIKEITIEKTGEKKKIMEKKAVSGMNSELWKKWIAFFLESEIPGKGDILICDRLRVHESQDMINLLSKSGIELRLLPVGSAPELSICDNSLFKDFKLDYSKKLNGKGSITREEKKKIIDEVWDEFPIQRIFGYWRKCGYIPRHPQKIKRTIFKK